MELNHFDKNGNAVMVDVSDKPVTHRTATATGSIQVSPEIMAAVKSGNVKKGDVLGVARVAGIMGVKRTSELIPMCHPLPIQKCSVDFETDEDAGVIRVFCTVKTEGKTGVEMEALTGVSTAHDIEHEDGAAEKAIAISGQQHIPVIRFADGSWLVEPSATQLQAKCKELGLI